MKDGSTTDQPIQAPYWAAVPLYGRDGTEVARARVSASDATHLLKWTWRLTTSGYAARSESRDGVKRTIYMHRVILQPPTGMIVDHVNGDRLDNRRSNLRIATPSQNCANSADRHRQSPFRGVYPHKPTGRWIAQVSEGGKPRHLGIFGTAEEAAAAYDLAATKRWGEYARTNLAG